MNVTVQSPPRPPAPPSRVHLDLSIEEFAALYRLYYSGLDGYNELRRSIDIGFSDALAYISPADAVRVRSVQSRQDNPGRGAEVVAEAFAS